MEDADDWTDEEDNEKLVKNANQVPLSELKGVIQSMAPSLTLITKIGYDPFDPLDPRLIKGLVRHLAI